MGYTILLELGISCEEAVYLKIAAQLSLRTSRIVPSRNLKDQKTIKCMYMLF